MSTHPILLEEFEDWTYLITPTSIDMLYLSADFPDTTPPSIDVISPTPGSQIAHDTAVVVDIYDYRELKAHWVWVAVAGEWEVVWAGNFGPRYAADSSRVAITGGWRYTLRRSGAGWSTAPTFTAVATDFGGNVT